MHSHIAGVSASARGRNVGFALKMHQRAWALLPGVCTIAWTYDPLVRRNAYFNPAKLGAVPHTYLRNFYGHMRDGINGGDESDRLLVHWQLDDPAATVTAARSSDTVPTALRVDDDAAELERGAIVALGTSTLGAPIGGAVDGARLLIAVPADIEALRKSDPALGREWRQAVRDTLATLMAAGVRVAGFDRTGWYVLARRGDREGVAR